MERLVSIGIFIDGCSPEIVETVFQLQKQTYANLEILIIDSSQKNIYSKKFNDSIDKRIKYYYKEYAIGFNEKIKTFLDNASGDFICFCNKASWYAPEYIELLVYLLNNNSASNYAFSNFHHLDEEIFSCPNILTTKSDEFRAYRLKSSFFRNIFFYWQLNEKINESLFFALFRKNEFELIYFKYNSQNYEGVGLIKFIVYNFIKSSCLALAEEPLIFFKNTDNINAQFDVAKILDNSKKSRPVKFLKIPFNILNYLSFINSFHDKIIIIFLFIIKFLSKTVLFIYTKILFYFKQTLSSLGIHYSNYDIKISFEEGEEKLQLLNVTLVAVSTRDTEEALKALIYSKKNIDYGKIILIANYTPYCKDPKIDFYKIPKFNSVDDWCKFIVYELHNYISTEFALLVHADGFVVNASSWQDEFLNYDYIGAPWDIPNNSFTFRDINGKLIRVGNSVSIRSKKLLELPYQLNIPWVADHGSFNEDTFLCCTNRHILVSNGIQYAPIEIAKYFAHESMIPETKNITPFAFHKWGGTNKIYPNFYPTKSRDYLSIQFYIFIIRSILDAFKKYPSLR